MAFRFFTVGDFFRFKGDFFGVWSKHFRTRSYYNCKKSRVTPVVSAMIEDCSNILEELVMRVTTFTLIYWFITCEKLIESRATWSWNWLSCLNEFFDRTCICYWWNDFWERLDENMKNENYCSAILSVSSCLLRIFSWILSLWCRIGND